MFGYTKRKKLRNRVIAAALGVFIMTFGIWLNVRGEGTENDAKKTSKQMEVEIEKEDKIVIDKNNTKDKDSNKDSTVTKNIPAAYLIKEVDGVVKVFLCNQDGSETLYLITSIPYELLSETDQNMLKEGVSIDTQEDLGRFLENFDS